MLSWYIYNCKDASDDRLAADSQAYTKGLSGKTMLTRIVASELGSGKDDQTRLDHLRAVQANLYLIEKR
jgi:hypothetical protein